MCVCVSGDLNGEGIYESVCVCVCVLCNTLSYSELDSRYKNTLLILSSAC